jgi:hypothetical protein
LRKKTTTSFGSPATESLTATPARANSSEEATTKSALRESAAPSRRIATCKAVIAPRAAREAC